MDNAFTLLDLSPTLQLTDEEITAAWEAKTKATDGATESLTEARGALLSPSSRLAIWLKARGHSVNQDHSGAIPSQLMDWFAEISPLLQRADALIQKAAGATSALTKALLTSEAMKCQEAVQGAMAKLHAELSQLPQAFEHLEKAAEPEEMANHLLVQLKFLEKWQSQLQRRVVELMAIS